MTKENMKQFFRSLSLRSVFKYLLLTTAFLLVLSFILVAMVWAGVFGPLPDKIDLKEIENPIATEVYSADSVLLGKYFLEERSNLRFEEIPSNIKDALIATEDIRFYEHHGVDTRSLARVLVKSILLQNESSGGGSTLTQQLAKNLYPRRSYLFMTLPINKVREALIAYKMEKLYTKQEILTLYLNTVPFGENTYGIETASQRFFSVPARSLTTSQAATLIGMLKATHSYNPRLFPERAKQRRNVILYQMEKYGMLTKAKADSARKDTLTLAYKRSTNHTGIAPYFREYIRHELLAWCTEHKKSDGRPYNLYTDGLKIYTTIDSRLQRYAEEAVTAQMKIIQDRFNKQHGSVNVSDEDIKNSERYRRLKEQGLSEKKIKEIMNTPVEMNMFSWQGEKMMKMSPHDSIKYYKAFLNTGVLAIDPVLGDVRVWVGGINHTFFEYDHVKESTKRQVGSTFKPIVYAAALEHGMKPCEYTSAEKTTYTNMEEWSPKNADFEKYDQKFSMEGGLAYSVNTVSVKILEKAGINSTLALAHNMGINSTLPSVPSLALGTADISMIEMVTAYSCFVNDGKTVKPFYLTAIADHQGTVLEKYNIAQNGAQVIKDTNAKLMIQMLKRTVDEGTASSLRTYYGITNDIAGKTGTTQSNTDGWFMGMTPHLVIGAWVGADDRSVRFQSTASGQGAKTALPIVANFFQLANLDASLKSITKARFAPLSSELEEELDCDLSKSDKNLLQKVFGKSKKAKKREFGKKKKGFLKKLFSKG